MKAVDISVHIMMIAVVETRIGNWWYFNEIPPWWSFVIILAVAATLPPIDQVLKKK